MNTPKHSPYPWEGNDSTSDHTGIYIGAPGRDHFHVKILTEGFSEEEIQANKALVEAAPELLAACEAALRSFDQAHAHKKTDCECELIRAAIAKAVGHA